MGTWEIRTIPVKKREKTTAWRVEGGRNLNSKEGEKKNIEDRDGEIQNKQ